VSAWKVVLHECQQGWELAVNKLIQLIKYPVVIVMIITLVLGARVLALSAKSFAPPKDITVVPGTPPIIKPGEPLVLYHQLYDVECGPDKDVKNAIIDLYISGGVPPYKLTFDPSNIILSDVAESRVRFTLMGGKRLVVRVNSNASDGEPTTVLEIYAPSHYPKCENDVSPSPFTSPSPSPSSTPSATLTQTKLPEVNLTGGKLDTDLTGPTDVKSPVPGNAINTDSASIKTSVPPTAVPPTAVPPTAVPPTAVPPTSAPPNKVECADGKDNDNDGKTDSADPECKGGHDNHEDK
jgi:hypothetical protein